MYRVSASGCKDSRDDLTVTHVKVIKERLLACSRKGRRWRVKEWEPFSNVALRVTGEMKVMAKSFEYYWWHLPDPFIIIYSPIVTPSTLNGTCTHILQMTFDGRFSIKITYNYPTLFTPANEMIFHTLRLQSWSRLLINFLHICAIFFFILFYSPSFNISIRK